MFNSFVIKNKLNQQYYIIRLAYQASPSRALKPDIIKDEFTAISFVNNLEVPLGYWESIGTRNTFYTYSNWRNSNPWKRIEEYAAAALVQGSLCAYKTTSLAELHKTAGQLTITNTAEGTLKIQPAAMLLLNNSAAIKSVGTITDALQIVNQLTINDEALIKLLNANNIPVAKSGIQTPSDVLASALLRGEFVVAVIPETRTSSMEMDYEMVGISNPGNPPPRIQKETSIAVNSTVDAIAEPTSLEECQERLKTARDNIIENGYAAKYSDKELVTKSKDGSVDKARFLVSFQPVNNQSDAKLAFQKDNGLVAIWASSFDMLENADSDPQIIADLLATGYDPKKDYVLHIVDRGEDLTLFGENTFVPTWDKLEEPAIQQLEPKYHDAIGGVLNSDYQKQYAAHMEDYWEKDLNEFSKKDQKIFLSSIEQEQQQFSARHALRTEFGANSEFTGDGMTQCRHTGNNHGVVETLTLENNPPTIAEMNNVTTIHLTPIKG